MEQSDACSDPGLPPTTCTYFGNEARKNIHPRYFKNYRKVLSLELEEVIEFLF